MMDEHGDEFFDPEFPPLEDDPILEEPDLEDAPVLEDTGLPDQSELWYNAVPDSGEEQDQSSTPDPAWEPQQGVRAPFEPTAEDPPAFVVDEGGELFSPEDDPLLTPPPPLQEVPIRHPMPPKYIPQRLRHLVSEPKQPVYRDPSGRYRPRG